MKSMFGYTRYQLCGLSQAIPTLWSVTKVIQHPQTGIRTRTPVWFAKCKVCIMRQVQSNTHCFAFTTQGETHTQAGDETSKKVVVIDSLALK